MDFVFMIMLGSKENSHHFFSFFKRTLILAFNNQFTKFPELYSLGTDADPSGRRASQLIKESDKHFSVSMYFLFYAPTSPPAGTGSKGHARHSYENLKESQGWNSRTDKKFVYTRHDYYFFQFTMQCSYFFNVVHLVCVVLFVVGLFNFFSTSAEKNGMLLSQ